MGCCESDETETSLLSPNAPNINASYPKFVPTVPKFNKSPPAPSLNSVIQMQTAHRLETQIVNSFPNSFSLGPTSGLDEFETRQQMRLEAIVVEVGKVDNHFKESFIHLPESN